MTYTWLVISAVAAYFALDYAAKAMMRVVLDRRWVSLPKNLFAQGKQASLLLAWSDGAVALFAIGCLLLVNEPYPVASVLCFVLSLVMMCGRASSARVMREATTV